MIWSLKIDLSRIKKEKWCFLICRQVRSLMILLQHHSHCKHQFSERVTRWMALNVVQSCTMYLTAIHTHPHLLKLVWPISSPEMLFTTFCRRLTLLCICWLMCLVVQMILWPSARKSKGLKSLRSFLGYIRMCLPVLQADSWESSAWVGWSGVIPSLFSKGRATTVIKTRLCIYVESC